LKKVTLLVIALFLSLSAIVSAQSSANCDVKVSIIKALSISNYGSSKIDFGEIIMNGTTQTKTVLNADGGHFLIVGQPNRNVTVTFPATLDFTNNAWVTTNGGTNGTITMTATADQTGKNVTRLGIGAITSGTPLPLVNNAGAGNMNVWIGGSITVPSTQANGDYLGTYTVSVAY